MSPAFDPAPERAAPEIERYLANLDAGILDVATSPMVSAWGRATWSLAHPAG